MKPEHAIVNLLISSVALVLLVRLYLVEYQEYLVQRTRFKLFKLRDELFALGAAGRIDFNDPAYGMLRKVLNGAIRWAHHTSLIDLAFFQAAVAHSESFKVGRAKQAARWEEAKKKLAPENRAELERIHRCFGRTMIEHTAMSSFALTLGLMPLAACMLAYAASAAIAKRVWDWVLPRYGPEMDYIATTYSERDKAIA